MSSIPSHSAPTRRPTSTWSLRTCSLELGRRTLVMGIVNITPDSFSDGGLFSSSDAAVAHALELIDDGADILDLGAESTRPGSHAGHADGSQKSPTVSAELEQARLLPVLEAILKAHPKAIVSVDTYKAATARAALAGGAEIINDVSGFTWDPALSAVCAQAHCGVILMHTRGRPDEWATQTQLESGELLEVVSNGLQASLMLARSAGIAPKSIVLDPGYGFGKHGRENFALLASQRKLLALGQPLLAGVSRKSFLGAALAPLHAGKPAPVNAREIASVAAQVAAILQGASIVRTHQVRSAREAALIADAVLNEMSQAD